MRSLVALAFLALAAAASAAETEVREFRISVDGKPSGTYTMTISKGDDGLVTMRCEAEVKVKVLGITGYSYKYQGVEIWKEGRLVALQTSCNDDGKKFTVRADRDGERLKVTVNGAEKSVRGDVWLTTAWFLPLEKFRNGPVPLMEADNGKEFDGTMQPVSSGALTVAGESRMCHRYRLTSSSPHDIWYDEQERMVRQEWTEEGHRTVLELTKRTRP